MRVLGSDDGLGKGGRGRDDGMYDRLSAGSCKSGGM
jgi:hypothetical protein